MSTESDEEDLLQEGSDSNDEATGIGEGWEEIQDLMVPARFYMGTSGERLEYGTSYKDYRHDAPKRMPSVENSQLSSGLLDVIGSLLGSGWTRKA